MHRFFIGIRLPQDLEAVCEKYRRTFKAPRTIAHITVIAPFTWKRDAQNLPELIQQSVRSINPFEIKGSDLGSFGKRVLFVNVELSKELRELQQRLAESLAQQGISLDERPYRPHITLATRLNVKQFVRYQKEVANFRPDYSFRCHKVSLFQFTKERRWQEQETIDLGPR